MPISVAAELKKPLEDACAIAPGTWLSNNKNKYAIGSPIDC
jgi:hypothetical protein